MQKTDPTAWDYEREYIRPDINWLTIVLWIIGSLFFASLITWLLWKMEILSLGFSILSGGVFILLLILINIKRILILFVRIYQRYASIKVRSMCRFEPSCSCYMIKSIEKYGAFKGTKKGINRIYRCGHGDGGFEEP